MDLMDAEQYCVDMWAVFTSTVCQLEIQVTGLKVTMDCKRLIGGHYVISQIPLAQLIYNTLMCNKQRLLDVMRICKPK